LSGDTFYAFEKIIFVCCDMTHGIPPTYALHMIGIPPIPMQGRRIEKSGGLRLAKGQTAEDASLNFSRFDKNVIQNRALQQFSPDMTAYTVKTTTPLFLYCGRRPHGCVLQRARVLVVLPCRQSLCGTKRTGVTSFFHATNKSKNEIKGNE
jgi:hypothetical protein